MVKKAKCGGNPMFCNCGRKPALTENLQFECQGSWTTAKIDIDLMNAGQIEQNERSADNRNSSGTLDVKGVA